MKHILNAFLAAIFLFVPASMAQTLVGTWDVRYTLEGQTRQLLLVAQSNHTGTFRAFMTPPPNPLERQWGAVWAEGAGFFSFSGEVQLNVGLSPRRQFGTLVIKADNRDATLPNCQVIFIQSLAESSSPQNYVIKTGTCFGVERPQNGVISTVEREGQGDWEE